MNASIRAQALKKLVKLGLQDRKTSGNELHPTLSKMISALPSSGEIALNELEIILALTSNSENVRTSFQAKQMLDVLSPLIAQAHVQEFSKRCNCGRETLAGEFATFLITIYEAFPTLSEQIELVVARFFEGHQCDRALAGFLKSCVETKGKLNLHVLNYLGGSTGELAMQLRVVILSHIFDEEGSIVERILALRAQEDQEEMLGLKNLAVKNKETVIKMARDVLQNWNELSPSSRVYGIQVLSVATITEQFDIASLKAIIKQSLTEHQVSEAVALGSLLNYYDEHLVSKTLIDHYPGIIASALPMGTIKSISRSMALGLLALPEDAVVSTVYAINNLIAIDRKRSPTITSTPSLVSESTSSIHENAIAAVVELASAYNDDSITVLAITILTQKFKILNKKLDVMLLQGLSHLATFCADKEFLTLIKFYTTSMDLAVKERDSVIVKCISDALKQISSEIGLDHPLYIPYLREILDKIVSCGEADKAEHERSHGVVSAAADEISLYLGALAALMPRNEPLDLSKDAQTTYAFRNVWFNMAIHGYHMESLLVKKYTTDLSIIAWNSPPLAADFPVRPETSLDLNRILRRGSSSVSVKEQKHALSHILNLNALEQKTMSYPNMMFLSAMVLLESLRLERGVCSETLRYFSDHAVTKSGIENHVGAICMHIAQKFIRMNHESDALARELNIMLLDCAHRDELLQDAAFQACDVVIQKIPSSLCHEKSMFTLLDLLTMMFNSVVDSETNPYEPTIVFEMRGSSILVSDSVAWRRETFEKLRRKAKNWVQTILKKANQDTKILLQSYISDIGTHDYSMQYGVSFALDMAGTTGNRELSKMSGFKPDTISSFMTHFSWKSQHLLEKGIVSENLEKEYTDTFSATRARLQKGSVSDNDVVNALNIAATMLITRQGNTAKLVFDVVDLAWEVFTTATIKAGISIWLTVMKERPELNELFFSEIVFRLDGTKGLFSREHDLIMDEFMVMEYAPYDKKRINHQTQLVLSLLEPHVQLFKMLSSHFESTIQSPQMMSMYTELVVKLSKRLLSAGSFHPLARMVRHEFISFGLQVLTINRGSELTCALVDAALSWFKKPASWPYGGNLLRTKADLSLMVDIYSQFQRMQNLCKRYCEVEYSLLMTFLVDEIRILESWLQPLKKFERKSISEQTVKLAFQIDPAYAFNLCERANDKKNILTQLVQANPLKCVHIPDALPYVGNSHFVLYWSSVAPVTSISLFANQNKFMIQYNIRSLESHDVNLVFFYVPQIVQSLRHDPMGYVERFILETASVSTLFSHQIIWNMLANSYKDDEATIEDSLKPKLDAIRESMVSSWTGKARDFYIREFSFFKEVTDISGKLKPYIKASKQEKKQKIDEEMQLIEVLDDCYLPCNPDGVVVDIDRKSGRPLQSHAKAPFMATFKIKKLVDGEYEEKWKSAIFKVGDDCRQDVLALQLISVFRSIWSNLALDVFVYPNRVTATAPGCGVIDVLPNSISRDMLGREAVNGLYEYYVNKFGGSENTIEFQRARNNLVKSLAGYSVISYLLQFKDRHNGNIMYDDQGHCLHIDFGFCFDIVPGGVKFEAVPFKLTKEMVKVMGGSTNTQAFAMFEDLCIKAFLAARPHMDMIINCVVPMLGSELPCFKGEKTIKNLRARFVPQKDDHEAALHMKGLIKRSYESFFTKGYDEFQRITNGIPY